MGYDGHTNGTSLPYDFHIPSATARQNGVMTKEQVIKLESLPDGPITNGKNAFTVLTADFVQPAVGASVIAEVEDSSWMVAPDQIVFVASGGYYSVVSKPDATHVELLNLGYPGNRTAGTPVPDTAQMSPGGLQGPNQQFAFGDTMTLSNMGNFLGVGASTFGTAPAAVMINGAVTLSKLAGGLSPALAGGEDVTFELFSSVDNGANYTSQASVTISGGNVFNSTTFGPLVLPDDARIYVAVLANPAAVGKSVAASAAAS